MTSNLECKRIPVIHGRTGDVVVPRSYAANERSLHDRLLVYAHRTVTAATADSTDTLKNRQIQRILKKQSTISS